MYTRRFCTRDRAARERARRIEHPPITNGAMNYAYNTLTTKPRGKNGGTKKQRPPLRYTLGSKTDRG